MRNVRNLAIIVVGLLLTWLVMPASLQTTIANNAADMSGKIVMVADSATGRTVTNNFLFDRGAAVPFQVGASSLKVTNLDADKLDGLDGVRYKPTTVTTTSTGTQNNFDPSGAIAAGNELVVVRCNNATDLTITGLVAGVDGQTVIFENIGGGGNVLFQDASGGAGSTIELQNIATSAATPVSTRGFAKYVYDTTSTTWRLTSHEQGAWITATHNTANFAGSGAMTWTVDNPADILVLRYHLTGRTLDVYWNLATTSTGGVASSSLQVGNAEYGGFTATIQGVGSHSYSDAAGANDFGRALPVSGSTAIAIQLRAVGNWNNAAVNNTSTVGSLRFEVN